MWNEIAMPDAAACFAAELERRGLTIPARLHAELRAATRAPFVSAPVLEQRLLQGDAVLRAHGDQDAPDELWDRWEAIFVAWCCCEQEIEELKRKGERRQRATNKPQPVNRVVQRENEKGD